MNRIDEIDEGSPITITTRNEKTFNGIYLGLHSTDEKEYSEKYENLRQEVNNDSECRLPALGEVSIRILSTDRKLIYLLAGIDYDGILIRKVESASPTKLLFKTIHKTELIDSEGLIIKPIDLEMKVVNGEVPLLSKLNIRTVPDSIFLSVDISDIAELKIPVEQNATLTGLLVGLGLDTAGYLFLRKLAISLADDEDK